jgi:ParB family chromosome partitioning protein
MGIKDLAIGRKDVYMVDPSIIQEDPGWNVRLDTPAFREKLVELTNSIKTQGVKMPLTVYMKDNVPILTDGHRRLMAVKAAIADGCPIVAVPVFVEERYANESDRVLSMITRNSGEPLTSLEMGEVFKRLMGFGWDTAKIAENSGYSVTHVENILALASAPVEVVEMVKREEVSPTTAIGTIKREGTSATEILKHAVEKAHAAGKKRATAKQVKNETGPAPEPSYVQWITEALDLLDKVLNTADMSESLVRKLEALMDKRPF